MVNDHTTGRHSFSRVLCLFFASSELQYPIHRLLRSAFSLFWKIAARTRSSEALISKKDKMPFFDSARTAGFVTLSIRSSNAFLFPCLKGSHLWFILSRSGYLPERPLLNIPLSTFGRRCTLEENTGVVP